MYYVYKINVQNKNDECNLEFYRRNGMVFQKYEDAKNVASDILGDIILTCMDDMQLNEPRPESKDTIEFIKEIFPKFDMELIKEQCYWIAEEIVDCEIEPDNCFSNAYFANIISIAVH